METSTHLRLTRATMAHYVVRRALLRVVQEALPEFRGVLLDEYRYTPFALERLPFGEGFLPTGFSDLARKPESGGIL